ncbi:MAG: MFS transporter [Chloroflexi bacterium]|nr:MAG: MFS transporter [Chloroflexota bacterium]MBL1195239.1 MFS transporter [Chloroflexota bacterium]NOH12525.1 MFS transporter [Chloroflexota bacterium]
MMKYIRLLFSRSYKGNIPKVFVYSFLTDFILVLPIWVLFLQQERGLTLSQVTIIDIALWATIVLAEVPTGAIADVFGRKASIIMGAIVVGFAVFLFGTAPSLALILVANSLWAIGMTFNSGAVQAIFYDSLVQLDREEEFTGLRGRLLLVSFAAVALSSFVGGWLGEFDLGLPFYLYSAASFLSLPFLLRLEEPPQESDPDTLQKLTFRRTLQITVEALRRQPHLRYILLYSSLIPVTASVVVDLFLQPYAASLGISIFTIGVIIAVLQLLRGLGSAASERLVLHMGAWNWLRIAPVLILVGILFLSFSGSISGILLFGIAIVAEPAIRPLIESLLLKNSPKSVRATILSVSALFFRLSLVIVEPGLGVLADLRGLPITFLVLGLITFGAVALTLVGWSPVWRIHEEAERPQELAEEPLPGGVTP